MRSPAESRRFFCGAAFFKKQKEQFVTAPFCVDLLHNQVVLFQVSATAF